MRVGATCNVGRVKAKAAWRWWKEGDGKLDGELGGLDLMDGTCGKRKVGDGRRAGGHVATGDGQWCAQASLTAQEKASGNARNTTLEWSGTKACIGAPNLERMYIHLTSWFLWRLVVSLHNWVKIVPKLPPSAYILHSAWLSDPFHQQTQPTVSIQARSAE